MAGKVCDQTGSALAGARVTLTNSATGMFRSVQTDESGEFTFLGISPATYQVVVEASNFKRLISSNVQAVVDSSQRLRITLEPGPLSATVEVSADPLFATINRSDARRGKPFGHEQIQDLPIDSRNTANLLNLQPGVTVAGYTLGGRSDQANVMHDGIDVNDQQTGGREEQFQTNQETVLRATAESVEEFRITTSNPNADQGRSSGPQISLVTRSGTNDLRGALFYFTRPTAFSANNFFNNAAGRYTADDAAVRDGLATAGAERAPRPGLGRDIFGGAIGGPIIKDKFFFFYTYEGQRQRLGVSVVRLVPLAHVGEGSLRFLGSGPGCSGGICTLNRAELESIYSEVGINENAVQALQSAARRYPANDTSIGDGLNTGGFRFNSPTRTDENTHIARFDLRLSPRQSIAFRGNLQRDHLIGTSQFPDTPASSRWGHSLGMMIGHDWAIGGNKVNNFRYGLTRQAFSTTGDSAENEIAFRSVFEPRAFTRTLSRISPTHNITDDLTWIKGGHTWQFGTNIRIIRNERVDFAGAYDTAVINPYFYQGVGSILSDAVASHQYLFNDDQNAVIQNTAAALIGRYSEYSGRYTFDRDGTLLPYGTPTRRTFATEEYDLYAQDIWKPRGDLTLTIGLRYGLNRPVYEANGFQVVTTEALGHFFERRKASAAQGTPVNDLVSFVPGGPVNDGPGFYSMDWKNWQPALAFAWSPAFRSGFLGKLLGKNGESVIRGGFRTLSDHFGGQLAVSFDSLSTIGFTQQVGIAANTFDITNCGQPASGELPRCGPRFTGFGQAIRGLPAVPLSIAQRFRVEGDGNPRIESSLDRDIRTPKHYTWNISYGRELPGKIYVEAAYIGRKARNLLAARDVMTPNNLVDPRSGMDWYTAAGMLQDLRATNTPIESVNEIPYFANLFPNAGSSLAVSYNLSSLAALSSTQAVYALLAPAYHTDWTTLQQALDDDRSCNGDPNCQSRWSNLFFHPQYAALSAFGSTGRSDYHGATLSIRQRLGSTLMYDINYAWSKSFDLSSGLQTGGSYGSQFVLNPLRPEDSYAYSDFDVRHNFNANFIFRLPVGRGQRWFGSMSRSADVLLGGWQLAGIARWNSGMPVRTPFEAERWSTNWNAPSSGVRIREVQISVNRDTQNAFSNPNEAYRSWRSARPGETGDRNTLRGPGYSTLDLGLSKKLDMPWGDGHKLQLRWEVLNVFNYQYFDGQRANFTETTWGLQPDPQSGQAPSDFGKIFSDIQGHPRRMQFGVRYSF